MRKKKYKWTLFDTVNTIILLSLLFVIVYPLYFTVIVSLSDPNEVANGNVYFWIKGLQFDAYRFVLQYKAIWIGYRNSIIYTAAGTLFALFLTIPAAYVLSKNDLPWRKGLMIVFLVIMYFSGGLIPTYFTVKKIGLLNQPLTLIILGSFSVFNMIIARTYFQSSIPESLYEAARVDGSKEINSFLFIALPLAKPIIAVLTLYYAVGKWNDFYTCLVYVQDERLLNLQMVLRNIILSTQSLLTDTELFTGDDGGETMIRLANMVYTMKYAVIFIASAPLLIAYPFVQKHFVKGVLIGSVKG